MTTPLFTYGTLEFPEVMETLTGRVFPSTPAVIENHGRYCLKNRSYPGLRHRAGETTAGTLYRGIDERSLRILDWFEDACYLREILWVTISDGSAQRAAVYLIPPSRYTLLSDRPWELERFRRETLKSYMRRCSAYHRQACAELGLEPRMP